MNSIIPWIISTITFGIASIVMNWVTRCVCYNEGLYDKESPLWLLLTLAVIQFAFCISAAGTLITALS